MCSHDDPPVFVKPVDIEAFQSYVSSLANAFDKDVKDDTMLRMTCGIVVWKVFTKKVSAKLNMMVEQQMDTASVHPFQLMKNAGADEWVSGWMNVYSSQVANCTSELLGEWWMLTPAGMMVTIIFQSYVALNYDWLWHIFGCISKNGSKAAEDLKTIFTGVKGHKPIKFVGLQDVMWVLKSFKKATALLPNLWEQVLEVEEFVEMVMLGLGLRWDLEALQVDEEDGAKVEQLWWHAKGDLDLNDLTDAEAMERTLNMYMEYFSQGKEEQFDMDNVQAGTLWNDMTEGDMGGGGDVQEEHGGAEWGARVSRGETHECPRTACNSCLQDQPFIWNDFKWVDNVSNAWEAIRMDGKLYVQGREGMEPIQLLWHQLAGVVAMVSKVWVAEGNTTFRAMLADDISVGKMAQVMATIAFTQLMYECEQQKQPRPALIKDLPSFMGKGGVPNVPHAIIVPNSLVRQWWQELKTFFKPNVIDIFILPTQKVKLPQYFEASNEGAWMKSRHEMICHIVLVPHSVSVQLTVSKSFNSAREGGASACVLHIAEQTLLHLWHDVAGT
ncbi:hypothetical protein APHAL10511_008608 [Amanita phalloides]|nr:hypothetical protein APHAL10511_008608 [Amanita phalloides]